MKTANKLPVYFLLGILVTVMFAAFDATPTKGAAGQRVLSIGDIGGDVRQLQTELHRKGYNLEPFDGIYGLRTHEAVMDLQKKNDLRPTGTFNQETREALRAGVRERAMGAQGEKTAVNPVGGKYRSKQVSRSMSREEVMMLARVVHGEARGEGFEGQVAVAAVVLNRTRSGDFPENVNGVVFQKRAFDAVNDGQIWLNPDEKSVKAAELAIAGYDPTGGALYYWNPAKSTNKWIWSRPIVKKIGDHVFAK